MIKTLKIWLLVGGLCILSSIAHAERSALWKNINRAGGHAELIAIAPSNPDIIYISAADVGDSSTLFSSRDGGETWTAVSNTGPQFRITKLVVSPFDPEKLYIALFNEIMVSYDGGVHWHHSNIEGYSTSPEVVLPRVTAFAADPNDPNIAYLSLAPATIYHQTVAVIYRSTDGGRNWFRINREPISESYYIDVEELHIDPATSALYIVFERTFTPLKSLDNGQTWTPLSGLPENKFVNSLVVDPRQADRLYATALSLQPDLPDSVFYQSDDGGLTWSVVSTAFTLQGFEADLLIDPADSENLYINNGGFSIHNSSDGGVSWNPLDMTEPGDYLQMLTIHPDGRLFAVNGAGVHVSNDNGSTWKRSNSGINRMTISQVASAPGSPEVVYTFTNNGVFKSIDSGQNWHLLDNVPVTYPSNLLINPRDHNILYRGHFRSNDGGDSWHEMDLELDYISGLAMADSAPNILYAGGITPDNQNVILRSDDGGLHWNSIAGQGFESLSPPYHLTVDPLDPNKIYSVIADFCYPYFNICENNLYRSDDGGNSWRSLEFSPPGGAFRELLIDPHSPQNLYFKSESSIYHSPDSGETWQPLDIDLPVDSDYKFLAFDPNNADTLYLGTEYESEGSALYRSRDGGQHWSAVGNHEMTRGAITTLAFGHQSETLYAGTEYTGLYEIIPDYPVVWWDAARSGQGLSLWPRGDRLWGAWFLYDESGEPIWLLFDGVPVNGSISAPLLRFRGPTLGALWDTTQVIGETAGQIDLNLSNPQTPQLNAVINGVNQSIDLDLSAFRPQADGPLSGVWWDPEQSGQGIVLSHQGDDLWGIFHRYDENGNDIWVIFQGQFQGNILNAELLHFTGPTLGAAWDESMVLDSAVGQVTVEQQAADQLIFNYTLNGHSSSLNLQPF